MPFSTRSRVGILLEVPIDLTGPLGDLARRELPESSIIARLEGSLRQIETHGG